MRKGIAMSQNQNAEGALAVVDSVEPTPAARLREHAEMLRGMPVQIGRVDTISLLTQAAGLLDGLPALREASDTLAFLEGAAVAIYRADDFEVGRRWVIEQRNDKVRVGETLAEAVQAAPSDPVSHGLVQTDVGALQDEIARLQARLAALES
jgi:hypothetical protein